MMCEQVGIDNRRKKTRCVFQERSSTSRAAACFITMSLSVNFRNNRLLRKQAIHEKWTIVATLATLRLKASIVKSTNITTYCKIWRENYFDCLNYIDYRLIQGHVCHYCQDKCLQISIYINDEVIEAATYDFIVPWHYLLSEKLMTPSFS